LKRVFDFLAAGLGLVLLAPVMLIVAALIKRSSAGPAVFAQTRVGRGERPFTCYKFRTMAHGAPNAGSHHVSGSWITPLGHKLRATKLDEIPQLFNVMRGDMSLVGPRPCLPSQTELVEARRERGVYGIRPGITGPAQLRGIDMSTPAELADVDAEYVRTRSFPGDLHILVMTVLGGGRGDAVKQS